MQLEVGTIIEGKVTGISKFGAFVELPNGKTGMVHISEISTDFVRDINDYVQENQVVKAQIIGISEKNEVSLSIKKLLAPKPKKPSNRQFNNNKFDGKSNRPGDKTRSGGKKSFEEMLSSFKHTSEEKISDLKRVRESKRNGSSRRGAQR